MFSNLFQHFAALVADAKHGLIMIRTKVRKQRHESAYEFTVRKQQIASFIWRNATLLANKRKNQLAKCYFVREQLNKSSCEMLLCSRTMQESH